MMRSPRQSVEPFQTVFAVPIHCEACVKSISKALHRLSGIHAVDADINAQIVRVTGTTAPSRIVNAIQQSTGRDAILRGSGGSAAAAVCILEKKTSASAAGERQQHQQQEDGTVRGLARMVQVTSMVAGDSNISSPRTLIDLVLSGVEKSGSYDVTVRETGDISRGMASVGSVWRSSSSSSSSPESALSPMPDDTTRSNPRGHLGQVDVGEDGKGSTFLDLEMAVAEVIGRGMVVRESRLDEAAAEDGEDETLLGVIARSAGIWENEKTVCSCSGKTVWEERREQVKRGVP